MDKCVVDGTLGGLSAAVFQHGAPVMDHSVGDLTRDSIVRMASMTKFVTSCCALCLVEEGLLSPGLDLTQTWLPELAQVQVLHKTDDGSVEERPRKGKITLHQLLTHTSGVSYLLHTRASVGEAEPLVDVIDALHGRYREAGVFNAVPHNEGCTSAEFLRCLARAPLAFEPGSRYLYSMGIDLAGIVIERVTGQSLGEVMRSRIFEPLGMQDTHFVLPEGKRRRLATLWEPGRPLAGAGLRQVPPGFHTSHPLSDMDFPHDRDLAWSREGLMCSGGAGLVSTLGDYIRFLHGVLASATGEPAGGCPPILSRRAAALLTSDALGAGKPAVGLDASRRHSMGCAVVVEPALAGELAPAGTLLWYGIYGTAFVLNVEHRVAGVLLLQKFPCPDEDIQNRFSNLVFQALE